MSGEGPRTVGDWIQRIASDGLATPEAFAKRYPDPVLVAMEQDTSSSTEKPLDQSGPTEFLDAAKLKSGALASREARVWVIPSSKPGDLVVGRARDCMVWI